MHNRSERMHVWGRTLVVAWALALGIGVTSEARALVEVHVRGGNGIPGGTLAVTMSITSPDPEDPDIATVQADLIFETGQLQLIGTCPTGGGMCQTNGDCPGMELCQIPCEKNLDLTGQSFEAVIPSFQNVPTGQRRVRLAFLPVFDPPLPIRLIPDGLLATCNFQIPADAPLGPIFMTSDPIRFQVADDMAQIVEDAVIEIETGSIQEPTVTATPSETATETPTGNTETPTPTHTPTATEETATATPSNTPTGGTPTITATITPTVTGGGGTLTPTPSHTPTSGTSGPTFTATPTTPAVTHTPTGASTATRTPTGPTATPTSGVAPADDDCSCRLGPETGASMASRWGRWSIPIAVLVWLRRRRGGSSR